MKTEEKTFADTIRSLRQAQGLSQAALAKRMGMTQSQLCKIELGHNGLSGASIRRVAEALGVTIAELMGETETTGKTDQAEKDTAQDETEELTRTLADDLPEAMVAQVAEVAASYDAKVNAARKSLGRISQSSLQLVYPYGVVEEAAELLSRDMRHVLGIGCAPIGDLERMLGMHGVRVVRHTFARQFQSTSFFNMRARTLVIVLNDANTQERNGYRLAYELGASTVFAMSGFRTIRDEGSVHRLLRRFTASFMMPEETVRMDVVQSGIAPDRWTFDLLVMMKTHFAVSAEAYALRLEELGLIAPALRVRLRDELRAYYPAHPAAMEPQAKDASFLAILTELTKEGK